MADQTVARRYHRLRSAGLLRVRGVVEASRTGRTQLIVRIRCTPGTVVTLADALARRGDVSWVSSTSGGAEIVCVLSAMIKFTLGSDLSAFYAEGSVVE